MEKTRASMSVIYSSLLGVTTMVVKVTVTDYTWLANVGLSQTLSIHNMLHKARWTIDKLVELFIGWPLYVYIPDWYNPQIVSQCLHRHSVQFRLHI